MVIASPDEQKDQKAETIAQIQVEEIMFRYWIPIKLLTDRGVAFLSEVIGRITELFQIHKLNTSPYQPQTDGLVERFNQTLQISIN